MNIEPVLSVYRLFILFCFGVAERNESLQFPIVGENKVTLELFNPRDRHVVQFKNKANSGVQGKEIGGLEPFP